MPGVNEEKNIRILKIPSQWIDWMDIYQGKTVFFVYFIYICVDLEF